MAVHYPGAAGGVTYWAPIAYNTGHQSEPLGSPGPGSTWGGWGLNSDSRFDLGRWRFDRLSVTGASGARLRTSLT